MFETLQSLLAFYGPNSKGIVWAHNSHVGNALATEMSLRGEHNIGQLCRKKWENDCYVIGFGTDHGTVAAASDWDEPMHRMQVRPARHDSYERIFHDSGLPAFMVHLRDPRRQALKEELSVVRLERAIGVVYRPETERASHYFEASLASQFDELIWFDETTAIEPLAPRLGSIEDFPQTYPFGT
jgi:protein-L-isoaspartate(D-aspartate) O-methyltransferase